MDAGVFRRLLCGGYVFARACYVDARVILQIAMMLLGSCYGDLGDQMAVWLLWVFWGVAMQLLGG